MKTRLAFIIFILSICIVTFLKGGEKEILTTASRMVESANIFLESLSPEQLAKTVKIFDDSERVKWHFIPDSYKRFGIAIKDLTEKQRTMAQNFLKSGLSQPGHLKVSTIIELETILKEMDGWEMRDPELYHFAVFGEPTDDKIWGWRFEGHHISLNYTVVKGELVATAPRFLGSNPGEVRQGPKKGVRALKGEEDLARALVQSLSTKQKNVVVFKAEAYEEIVTGNESYVEQMNPEGISASEFTPEQLSQLLKIIEEYISTLPVDLATIRTKEVEKTDLQKLYFGWAGSIIKGKPHYYRIQGPTFLIEYDNTQNDANHIHSVWRDFNGDFGRDIIQDHYKDVPHQH
jgi:hypothetical protein